MKLTVKEEILSKSNMQLAYTQVTGDKGAAGIDGVGVAHFAEQLKTEWLKVKLNLETGVYQPQPAKRVKIPKPNGGERNLGIPTYMDRLIQPKDTKMAVDRLQEQPIQSFLPPQSS
jgi:RNA-directed DNA polymerase